MMHLHAMTGLVLVTVLAGAACSQPVERQPVAPILVQEDQEEPEGTWAIPRTEYERVLKEGLHPVMRWYFVKPAYRSSRFVGYQVFEIYKKELKKGPLRVGDVLLAVNGQPVERPEHALAVWRGLWGRKTLKLDVLRKGRNVTYDIPIQSP